MLGSGAGVVAGTRPSPGHHKEDASSPRTTTQPGVWMLPLSHKEQHNATSAVPPREIHRSALGMSLENARLFDEVREEIGSWRTLARALLMYDKPS